MIKLATLSIAKPRQTLAIIALISIVALVVALGAPSRFSYSENELLSHNTQSYKATQLLHSKIAFPNIAVIFPAGPEILRSQVLAEVQKVAQLVPQRFQSNNGQSLAVAGYINPQLTPGPTAAKLVKRFRSYPQVTIGGSAALGQELSEQIGRDAEKAGLIAFPLLLIIAFCVFRSVVSMLLPALVCGTALSVTLSFLRLINEVTPISILSLNLITAVGVALAIDYSLLLVSRYREELLRHSDPSTAALMAVATAGRTVTLSSATVMASFASLLVFPLGFIRSIAIGCMLVAIVSGLVSMIVLPAMFSLLGPGIDALGSSRYKRTRAYAGGQGFWYLLAHFVMKRPLAVAACATALLMAFGAPALGMRLTGLASGTLPTTASAREFEERAVAEFRPSVFSELVVIARGGQQRVAALYARHIKALPDIKAAEVNRIGGDLWGFFITTSRPPFSHQTESLVREIRATAGNLAVTGIAAEFVDTRAALRSQIPLAIMIMAIPTLILLFVATGSILLPLKALVMILLSLTAACGLVVLVFQDGRFEALLDYHGVGALALTLPYLLVASTFGILTDYSIFLLTRIKEGWDAGLSNREAIAHGLERTGRIVTAAALLFCVAVGVLITANLVFVKEVGFGIAIAVAIDATIVRAFLVPSLMALFGRWNWWRPELPRRRWRRRASIQDLG